MVAKEEDDEITWFYGEEEVAISDFRTALASLTATEFKEEEISAKEEISLTLYLDDENYETVQIGLYRQDGESCMAVVDGKSTAFVARSEVVNLVEAVNAIVLN